MFYVRGFKNDYKNHKSIINVIYRHHGNYNCSNLQSKLFLTGFQ